RPPLAGSAVYPGVSLLPQPSPGRGDGAGSVRESLPRPVELERRDSVFALVVRPRGESLPLPNQEAGSGFGRVGRGARRRIAHLAAPGAGAARADLGGASRGGALAAEVSGCADPLLLPFEGRFRGGSNARGSRGNHEGVAASREDDAP